MSNVVQEAVSVVSLNCVLETLVETAGGQGVNVDQGGRFQSRLRLTPKPVNKTEQYVKCNQFMKIWYFLLVLQSG